MDRKATTFKISEKAYNLFQQKVLADKITYYNLTKQKVNLSVTRVVNAYLYLYIHNKLKLNFDIGDIVDNNALKGIELEREVLIEAKKVLIEEEIRNNDNPYPRGISGLIGRIMQTYLRMDFREVISKVLEWEKLAGEGKK